MTLIKVVEDREMRKDLEPFNVGDTVKVHVIIREGDKERIQIFRGDVIAQLLRKRIWKPVRILGLDGAYVLGWGEKRAVLVAVDMGEGLPVGIDYLDEADPQAVKRWLEPLVKRLGISVIVTDDLMTYRTVADQLGLEHQVCQFHLRRWVGRALHELQGTLPEDQQSVLEEVKQLIDVACRGWKAPV